jgi:hypothetical protein
LNHMALFMDRLPNRLYHTGSGRPVNYGNEPEAIGWSAIDLGRLLLWLSIVGQRQPHFREYVDKVVLRLSFCEVIDPCGGLFGGSRVHDRLELAEEGRLGYQQYAAKGYAAWGFATARAERFAPTASVRIEGVDVLYDARDPRETGVLAPLLTGPFVLAGLELNWDRAGDTASRDTEHTDSDMADLAARVYAVQEARFRKGKVLTARTDHPLSSPPFFVFDSVFASGYPWSTLSDRGDPVPDKALVSVRAAFGLWALWKTDYTDRLMAAVKNLNDPQRGWFEGRFEGSGGYERTISASTNAVVLESLLYKEQGKLYGRAADGSYLAVVLGDAFRAPGHCFPAERPACSERP